MALIFIELVKVRLNGCSSRVQKNNAHGIARNTADKLLRVVDHATDAAVKIGYIDGMRGRQRTKFFRRKPAVPRNVSKHFFRRLTGKPAHGGAYRRAKRKDVFVDGHEVNDVTRLAPVGCGRCLVRRQVHGMQHVAEKLIALRWKKTKRGI